MRKAAALVFLLALGLAGCKRDELVGVDPEVAPGPSSKTRESILAPSQLASWTDTVFSGYASAATATYQLVEEGTGELVARSLFRFDVIQDSVFFPDTTSAVIQFDSARVIVGMDTLLSALGSAGTTLRLIAMEEEWDEASASWGFAIDTAGEQVPWAGGPGGSLGATLAELQLTSLVDSLIFELGERSDSLIRSWNDTTQANPGLALVVADSGRLFLRAPRVQFRAIPEVLPDTAVVLRAFATARTFIFDREASELPPGALRLGGVDGWRMLTELILPDSVPAEGTNESFSLRGVVVNRAEIILLSLAPPDRPFAAENDFGATAFELAADFRILGPKTPVGNRLVGSDLLLEVDSLESGSPVRFDVTDQLQRWAAVPLDSVPPPVRIVIRSLPEGATFGYWEFGAARGDPDLAPFLRIVFTPPARFDIP
ncbi:MAG: hypothetical protein JSU87_07725 [Gemmatimonadota bacterium]|nr:MAG: hypothetical protein JSU87_07725 [Gemmatimonadota bacterium]